MAAFRIFRRFRELLDVTFGTPSDGDVPTYDAGSGKLVMAAPTGGGGGLTFPQILTAFSALGIEFDDVTGNVVFPEGSTGAAALKIMGVGATDPSDLASQSQIYVNAPHRGWAVMTLMDSQSEGEASRGVLEFGSAQGGTNSPSRLSNTGGVYLSTIRADEPVIDLDTADTGWGLGPSTAPVIRFGSVFFVGPDGSVTAAPSAAVAAFTAGGSANLAMDAGSLRIANVADPSNAQDADTKAARDAAIAVEASARSTADALKLAKASNLSDLASASTARTNLGLVIGTDVEAHDADLTTIAGLTPTNDDVLQRKAGAWANRTIAQIKSDLSLSGTNTGDQTSVTGNAGTATALQTARNIDGQSFDGTANITVIAPGTHAATGKTTPVDADELPLVDSAASNVLKKLTWANVKATLKTYFDTLYAATGAYAPGGTDVAVADGGTGSSTASGARTNLGLVIGTDVQAQDSELAALAGLTSAANKLPYFTGSGTAALADLSAFIRTLLDDADAATARATLGVPIIQLFDSTLGSSAANFDITSISGSYSQLILYYVLRNDGAVTLSNVNVRLNNDSGSNYDVQRFLGNSGTAGASASSAQTSFLQCGYTNGASGTAGNFGYGQIFIPNYAGGSTANRGIVANSGAFGTAGTASTYASKQVSGNWRSTAAITRITLIPDDGSNWVAGSRVTLYGVL